MTLKLLVVEDSELIRTRLLAMLDGIAGLGPVHCAETLAQTMECVGNLEPELVLLDLYLPDGHALSIVPVLQALAPAMQIAVLTTDAGAGSRARCLQAGVHWFFDKSTEFPAAIQLVRSLAASRHPVTAASPLS